MSRLSELLKHIKSQHKVLEGLLPLSPEQQKKVKNKFRLEFNFNSNHIEGNTLTYGETELLLLFDLTNGNHELREYEEMKAHDVALKMVEQEAADLERPLLEQFIRTLNKHLLVREYWKEAETHDGQPTRKKIIPGEYKTTPNSVRLKNGEIFDYTAPENVAEEIRQLVSWYNEHEAIEDPVILASMLHYSFVRIHPFDDGNGRVSRLLMNYALIRKGYPMVVIKTAEKQEYLAALHRADAGDKKSFTEHIGMQILWSFDIWIKAAKGEDINEPDDLDKELALLKSELDTKPDNFDKRKSNEELRIILTEVSFNIGRALKNRLSALAQYFVNIGVFLGYEITHSSGGIKRVELLNPAMKEIESRIASYPLVKSIYIKIDCTALKKARELTNVSITNTFQFDDFHYSVVDDMTKKVLIQKAYGQQPSDSEINSIVDYNLRYIIEQIRLANK